MHTHNRHDYIHCDWKPFKQELLVQWHRLDEQDLAETGRNRHLIACAIERKYGVAWQLAEHYLSSLETSFQPHRMAA